jgi:hypothetical protein
MVLRLKWFPMRLNFKEAPLTYGMMTVPWYIVSEFQEVSLTYEMMTVPWYIVSEFQEVPLTYEMMIVPWYIVSEEGRFLTDGFIREPKNSLGYSLSIR